MSAVVTFVPDELYDFAAQANTWAVALREEAFDLEGALARFRAGSGEFVPAVPDHPVTIEGLCDRLAALADSVAALGAAAEQADREGLRLRDVLLTVSGGIAHGRQDRRRQRGPRQPREPWCTRAAWPSAGRA